MTMRPDEERPVEVGDVPPEEAVSTADAADRADLDPEEQPNRTDVEGSATGHS